MYLYSTIIQYLYTMYLYSTIIQYLYTMYLYSTHYGIFHIQSILDICRDVDFIYIIVLPNLAIILVNINHPTILLLLFLGAFI